MFIKSTFKKYTLLKYIFILVDFQNKNFLLMLEALMLEMKFKLLWLNNIYEASTCFTFFYRFEVKLHYECRKS